MLWPDNNNKKYMWRESEGQGLLLPVLLLITGIAFLSVIETDWTLPDWCDCSHTAWIVHRRGVHHSCLCRKVPTWASTPQYMPLQADLWSSVAKCIIHIKYWFNSWLKLLQLFDLQCNKNINPWNIVTVIKKVSICSMSKFFDIWLDVCIRLLSHTQRNWMSPKDFTWVYPQ